MNNSDLVIKIYELVRKDDYFDSVDVIQLKFKIDKKLEKLDYLFFSKGNNYFGFLCFRKGKRIKIVNFSDVEQKFVGIEEDPVIDKIILRTKMDITRTVKVTSIVKAAEFIKAFTKF